MSSSKKKDVVRPEMPTSLGDAELTKVSGAALHPVFPPGQFPAPVKPGWHPGK
jgi:hypothetical protein